MCSIQKNLAGLHLGLIKSKRFKIINEPGRCKETQKYLDHINTCNEKD